MFKEMRRSNKALDEAKAIDLLAKGSYGILSTVGEDGYCYGVPLNYVYYDNSIYFHCAQEGHKIDNLNYNNKVSFTVVGKTDIIPEKFTAKYTSIIAFGQAHEVNEAEKEKVLIALVQKYSPAYEESGIKYVQKAQGKTKVIKIAIEKLSGKGQQV